MSIQTNKLPDNPNIDVIKAGKTGLFTNYIYKAIPLAFDESMSYYETLLGLLHYLKNVIIPTVNNNADAVAELQTLYEELRTYVDDYFTNLDVQEEINNKLDEMVEDGTLDQIIEQYLNSSAIWGFDSVADMKNATNLINGSYAHTLGYYTSNDGGEATYKITNEESQTEYQEELDNGLYATLIVKNNMINIKQLGAKSDDNTFDNSLIIQSINDKNYDIFIPSGNFYIKNCIKINIANGTIFGNSTKSSLIKHSVFNDDEMVLIYSTGDYETRNQRIKSIHDFSIRGLYNNFEKIGLKIGGNTSTDYEGHVECVNFKNIHIKNFNTAIYLNSHIYKNIFENIIIDQVYYNLKSDENQQDMNESTNFIGCSFWSGSMYLKMDSNFIGCTFHINHQETIQTIITNIFIDECMVNFNDCHFESLNTESVPLTSPLENIIVSRYSTVNIDNPHMLVSGNKITINDSVFKTINPDTNTVKNISTITLKNGKCKYFFGRITPGTNFTLCKGKVNLFIYTIYKNDPVSSLGYKIYDYSSDNILTNTIINPLIKENALTNAIMTINSNTYNFTKESESENKFGLYKIFKVNNHKSVNIIYDATSNNSNVKLQKRYNSLQFDNSSIVFLDKEGNVINETIQPAQYKDGQSLSFNALLGIPENCEYIKFGIIGYGFQYQTNVTFTIEKLILELC